MFLLENSLWNECYHGQARCVTRFPDDEHPGSSSTANGRFSFSVIHSYLSKRNYPRCLCVTAFQMVHFQIAYHSRVISPSHTKWNADGDLTSVQQKLETCELPHYMQMHIVWQWVRTPATLTTTKVQCEGFSTSFHFKCVGYCSNSDTDNWKCSTCSVYVLMSFKILFLVICSRTLFLIGQHTLHNFNLQLTATRVTDYNMMYGGPNLTRGASKC